MAADHYGVLGLDRQATEAEVRRAFRQALRTAHPDRGGTAEQFHAVQEAHRVLTDPVLREAYHRELDGAAPEWDEIGWGHDPTAPPAPYRAEPGPAAVELDPFAPGHVDLPDPALEPAVEVPAVRPGPWEWITGLAAAVLAVASVVLAIVNDAAVPGTEDDAMGGPYATVLLGSVAVGLLMARRWRATPLAWLLVPIALVSPGWVLAEERGIPWAQTLAAATAWAAIAAGLVWAPLFRRRREDPLRVAAISRQSLAWRVERHRRASEWNRVRELLEESGVAAVLVGPAALDRRNRRVPGRWTHDPRTGTHTVRLLPEDVVEGTWVVLDRDGVTIATAPAGAPWAWREILAEAR